jgi:glycosyltransferase involved in cell wall biosynthesis
VTVTVVIPVRAPAPYLSDAISSVIADEPGAEVIVVENGSSTLRESELIGARLVQLPASGRSAARNEGVRLARSDCVAFLDADDLSVPGRLLRQCESLDQTTSAVLSFGLVEVFGDDTAVNDWWNRVIGSRFAQLSARPITVESLLETRCPAYPSAMAVRREPFLAAGGFDTDFEAYEDLELCLRLGGSNSIVACPGGPVTRHRVHPGNTASDTLYEASLRVVAKHLPGTRGRVRRLLLARRVDSLWGLGYFGAVRRDALRALLDEPLLLTYPGFLKRLAGAALPARAIKALR